MSLVYPEGQKVTYQYDKNGKLTKMTDWQGRATSYAYDANSMLVQTKRPDGTIETKGKYRFIYENESCVIGLVNF